MSIPIKLEAFEGPLDLLLHLIDKNKINIYDIPIVDITEQYMEYIRFMQNRNMDVMSEFLVMAATLLRIKSQMLLPQEVKEEAGEFIDPRQDLVDRLLEYKMYRYISNELKDKQIDASHILFKASTIPKEILEYREEVDVEALLTDLTLSKLHTIFQSILKKKEDSIDPVRSKFGRIEREEINLYQKIMDLQMYGLEHPTFRFRQYLELLTGRVELVVSFLGILELIRIGRIKIVQQALFDDIIIEFLANDIAPVENFMPKESW